MAAGRGAFLRQVAPFVAPVLFAAYPLLSLYAHNQTEVELGLLWWPLAWCVGAAVLLYGVFMLIFKRGTKAGALASLVVATFFAYGIYSEKALGWGLADRWFLPLWAALFVLGAVALVRTRRDLATLTLGLTVGAVVLVVGPVARIAIYEANHHSPAISDPGLWPTALAEAEVDFPPSSR